MTRLPSRHRRLDDALADLPLEEPMLLSELDGFLTGVLLSPAPILPDEWFVSIWGIAEDGSPPFGEPADVRWFTDAVMARYTEIARDLGRGKPQPIFEVDERNGDVIWEIWIAGFAEAMDLRPESWAALAEGDDPAIAAAVAELSLLIAIVDNTSALDTVQINAMQDAFPVTITTTVLRLHAAGTGGVGAPPLSLVAPAPAKVGRNDPCPCGSGKKSKRCCA
ncbi:UPF0149 family protein [Sphingomonas sp. PAMC 26621]|uniref:UPF0149 family protein n=1 Tax=Sphingomonas sp. PAMC 26621 TaxID=1112213 RepID=UPI0002895CB6|nr:UPF0149 family protein [Sphingomonas sp. PAMC 26621]